MEIGRELDKATSKLLKENGGEVDNGQAGASTECNILAPPIMEFDLL